MARREARCPECRGAGFHAQGCPENVSDGPPAARTRENELRAIAGQHVEGRHAQRSHPNCAACTPDAVEAWRPPVTS